MYSSSYHIIQRVIEILISYLVAYVIPQMRDMYYFQLGNKLNNML